jgi:hypothetical protein
MKTLVRRDQEAMSFLRNVGIRIQLLDVPRHEHTLVFVCEDKLSKTGRPKLNGPPRARGAPRLSFLN